VVVHRDYGLPAWARGPETLVIASSHSGNTEEVLDAFGVAQARNCQLLAITTGGALAHQAQAAGIPVWRFEHKGQPRAAVGFSFCLLLAALARLDLVPDPASELEETISAMRAQQLHIQASVPDVQNPAKRLAGQLVGRLVTIIGSDVLAPVARRWKGQINELAKAWGTYDNLPEADHNSLAGSLNPPETLSRVVVIFLRAPSDHPRNRKRADLTRQILMLNGIGTESHDALGESRLAHLWTALHYGDYVGYYLAMAYEVDPSPVDAIESFKKALGSPG
jgi:glucose/mannose-6-phosphate isomerase